MLSLRFPLLCPLLFLGLVNDPNKYPLFVPRLHYLRVLPPRLLSSVADTTLPDVSFPSNFPDIAVFELVVVGIVGIDLAVVGIVVVAHASGCSPCPLHVR